ncbi:uncharacterized protein CANTADRAFT_259738 [Suhomyces tanzawaensis NRRL Y-17324]|uniref:Uncharacterized protein n=1 Tax=Suhomyces tanzawaensis NRRL Y-17324 TaxID=984487 RepID=A0A1E4SJ61_9ASCO|nr:uncharacterized protein CANTADRAFT_259738 [Suhomyces tanzawaensis NRRL Y-17324]ODV79472.1 hypothetical protein CANTADRAFT_259738 [Suhomyces tanzawaensis NRRL Y-17324]
MAGAHRLLAPSNSVRTLLGSPCQHVNYCVKISGQNLLNILLLSYYRLTSANRSWPTRRTSVATSIAPTETHQRLLKQHQCLVDRQLPDWSTLRKEYRQHIRD